MPITQKPSAGAKPVPVLWRDCAWRVRIFVHTRIAKLPAISALGYPGGRADNSPTFQRWVRHFKVAQVPNGRLTLRTLSAVPLGRGPRRGVVPNVETLSYCRVSLRDKGVRRLHRELRASYRSGAGLKYSRSPVNSLPWRCPNGCANHAAARRLRPILAFAASQLGGLAPSRLRIYSVFEKSLPSKL